MSLSFYRAPGFFFYLPRTFYPIYEKCEKNVDLFVQKINTLLMCASPRQQYLSQEKVLVKAFFFVVKGLNKFPVSRGQPLLMLRFSINKYSIFNEVSSITLSLVFAFQVMNY